MTRFLKVDNDHSLARDKKSGAIVSIDETGYENFLKMRAARLEAKNNQESLAERVENIEKKLETVDKIHGELISLQSLIRNLVK